MANLDRSGIIELLGRLGADSDETVLHAGRELHRRLSESGLSWDDLIRPEPLAADAGADAEPGEEPRERAPADKSSEAAGVISAADRTETARVIERLLVRKDLSTNLREELAEMKRALADGSLDAMDRRYLRALAKRLGA